jgi:SAM-dependent methyltransferase
LKGELEAPSRILVPGCGRGHEVLLLCAKGFEVTAVDFAPFPIQHLQTEVTRKGMKAEIIELDILEAKFETPFDAIYEQTCLCALEPSNWTQYEQQIRSFLKPGGKLFALFMQTTEAGGPPFHCDISEMRELFSEAHWIWPTETGKKYPHPAGIYEYAVVLEKKVTP